MKSWSVKRWKEEGEAGGKKAEGPWANIFFLYFILNPYLPGSGWMSEYRELAGKTYYKNLNMKHIALLCQNAKRADHGE